MAKRKGINYRKRYAQRKRSFAAALKKAIPRIFVITAVIAVLCVLGYGLITGYDRVASVIDRSHLFLVRNISVKGNNRIDKSSIIERCAIGSDARIYNVETATITASLLADPWIESVRCVKKWWGTVSIEVCERKPIALVNLGEVKLVDRHGVLLPVEPSKSYSLPLISGVRILRNGHIDSVSILRVAQFVSNLKENDESFLKSITQIDVGDSNTVTCMSGPQSAIIKMEYGADAKQIRNLRYLLNALPDTTDAAPRIDMRYKNIAFVCYETVGASPVGTGKR